MKDTAKVLGFKIRVSQAAICIEVKLFCYHAARNNLLFPPFLFALGAFYVIDTFIPRRLFDVEL